MKTTALICSVFLVLLFATVSCTSDTGTVKSDLDTLCALAVKINKDETIPADKRPANFMSNSNKLNLSAKTQKFLIDLSNKQEISYNDVVIFAQKNEVENFSCEALKELIGK